MEKECIFSSRPNRTIPFTIRLINRIKTPVCFKRMSTHSYSLSSIEENLPKNFNALLIYTCRREYVWSGLKAERPMKLKYNTQLDLTQPCAYILVEFHIL